MREYPVPYNETERLKALRNYQILDTIEDEEFDKLTELAALICEVPISMLSLIDESRQWIKSKHGLDIDETPRQVAFCQYTIMGDRLLEIEDATADERFKDSEYVLEVPHVRFYAGYPLVDPDGYSLGTICVLDTKIRTLNSKQKKALELLASQAMALIADQRKREELKHFERLYKRSNDLICIAGTDGYFKKVNPAFKNVLGWDEKFLLETPFLELVHPDDREKTILQLNLLASGESTINFVQRFRSKSGDYLDLQWVTTPEQETGNLFAIARDITAEKIQQERLRISEDNFRSFFENSQGLMCTHDMNGNFITVNAAGAGLLGYTTEEVLKMSLFDIVPVKHHDALNYYLLEISKNGKSKGLMTTNHKDGSIRIWSFHNIVLKNHDGGDYVVGNSIDITQSHQLARNLQKMQEMLLQTNEMARVGGWEVDFGTKKVNWSEVTKQIHQVPADFQPDMETGLDFYLPESKERLGNAIALAVANGTSYDLELELITTKGEEIWVRAMGNAEMQNGKCKRLYGTFQDINEKKRAELAINNSRKLLDDVLNAASEVSVIATDVDGIITVFNKGAEKLLGYSAEEVIGKVTPGIIHLEEEVQVRSRELTLEYNTPVEGFRTFVHKAEIDALEVREWTFKTKNGFLFPVSMVVTTIRNYQNDITGYLGVATDLSARKKAEQELSIERARLLAFVERAPAAVAMLDKDIKYLAISRKWLEEYRLTDRNIIGLSHYEVFPNIGQEWKDIHQRCLQGSIFTQDEDIWRPEGWSHDQYLKWEVRPWYQFDGSVGGIMMFTQDVTAIALSRDELRQAKLQSEQASIAKSEFLANMSHEIRTPLNGVIGFTDLVLKTKMTDTQKQYLGIVNQSANALLSIINDILDFSKIEAGKLELDIDKCDIYEIAAQSADIISFQIQNKGLEMLLNIPSNLPRFVWVDEIRLKQVLINLLSNAAKFTETGEIELKIELLKYSPLEKDNITCRFVVRDTGIGIREEKQNKIFEAFLQEDGSTTKKYGGTGLGLTISNKLLGMMGSKLQLKSNPGTGSTFFFDLTMRSEPGEPIAWENVNSIKRVLIVDDSDNNRVIMHKMLQLLEIESDEARDGFEALEILASGKKFDAVLMDYHMPNMDGLETISKIRQIYPKSYDELRIVLLNSSADDATVLKGCEDLKITSRLMKPIKLSDISLCLSRLSQKTNFEDLSSIDESIEITDQRLVVLIAEDNPVNMFLAKTIINKIAPNAEIIEAENGIRAVEFCKKKYPSIIFMDVQMPEMNGYEATLAIRSLPGTSHIPIVALTAGNVTGEREKCIEAGMDDFIAKPFVEETIWQVFNKFRRLAGEDLVMSKEVNSIKTFDSHFDVKKLREMYMNDTAFIAEFLLLTKDSLLENMADLKKHYATANLAGIKSTGHRLKGAASSAFLTDVTNITSTLEHLTSFDESYIGPLLSDLEKEIEFLLPVLTAVERY